jgi:hypothetical protein
MARSEVMVKFESELKEFKATQTGKIDRDSTSFIQQLILAMFRITKSSNKQTKIVDSIK